MLNDDGMGGNSIGDSTGAVVLVTLVLVAGLLLVFEVDGAGCRDMAVGTGAEECVGCETEVWRGAEGPGCDCGTEA